MGEVSISKRYLYRRGVYMTKVSIPERCLYRRGVYIGETSILESCLNTGGKTILDRFPHWRGVYFRLQRLPNIRDVLE